MLVTIVFVNKAEILLTPFFEVVGGKSPLSTFSIVLVADKAYDARKAKWKEDVSRSCFDIDYILQQLVDSFNEVLYCTRAKCVILSTAKVSSAFQFIGKVPQRSCKRKHKGQPIICIFSAL